MKRIPLTQGKFSLVDDEDYKFLMRWKWCISNGYAVRTIPAFGINGRKTTKNFSIHRVLMSPPPDKMIDHIDGNKLNNQRINLRICTHTENLRNMKKIRGVSKYKGVVWRKERGKWQAQISVNNICVYLGLFEREDDAAQAYNFGAEKYYGEFARFNLVS